MANKKPDQQTARALTVRVLIAAAQRAATPACCVSDEPNQVPPRPKRIEYNLFRSAAAVDHVPLIPLEEADRDWLDSMEAEGWPVLPPDFFKRHFVDSGDDVALPEVPLRYTVAPTPPESAKLVRAAA